MLTSAQNENELTQTNKTTKLQKTLLYSKIKTMQTTFFELTIGFVKNKHMKTKMMLLVISV